MLVKSGLFIRVGFEVQPKCSVVFLLGCEIIAVFVYVLAPTIRKTTGVQMLSPNGYKVKVNNKNIVIYSA